MKRVFQVAFILVLAVGAPMTPTILEWMNEPLGWWYWEREKVLGVGFGVLLGLGFTRLLLLNRGRRGTGSRRMARWGLTVIGIILLAVGGVFFLNAHNLDTPWSTWRQYNRFRVFGGAFGLASGSGMSLLLAAILSRASKGAERFAKPVAESENCLGSSDLGQKGREQHRP